MSDQRLSAFARDCVQRELAEWQGRERCDLTAQDGYDRCSGKAVAVRWEDGFPDKVCEHHAHTAEARGALVVRPEVTE